MVAALQEVAGELGAVIKRVRGTEHEVEDLQRVVALPEQCAKGFKPVVPLPASALSGGSGEGWAATGSIGAFVRLRARQVDSGQWRQHIQLQIETLKQVVRNALCRAAAFVPTQIALMTCNIPYSICQRSIPCRFPTLEAVRCAGKV